MRFNTITTLIATALVMAGPSLQNECIRQHNGGIYTYIVTAPNFGDGPGTCGGLWDNLVCLFYYSNLSLIMALTNL